MSHSASLNLEIFVLLNNQIASAQMINNAVVVRLSLIICSLALAKESTLLVNVEGCMYLGVYVCCGLEIKRSHL